MVGSEGYFLACGFEYVPSRESDFRIVVVGEGVVENQDIRFGCASFALLREGLAAERGQCAALVDSEDGFVDEAHRFGG